MSFGYGTSFTLHTLQKIRAKEKRFLKANERDFLKYIEDKNDVTVFKKNVISILKVDYTEYSIQQYRQAYSDILLKRIKKQYESSMFMETTFFERYKNFVLA